MWDLSKEAKLVRVKTSVAAAQVTINSAILNMSGYDAVLFALLLNSVTATSVITLIGMDNALNQAGGMANITDAGGNTAQVSVTDVGGASTGCIMVLDIVLPQQQFVQAQVTIGVANTAIDGILAILYRSKTRPALPLDTLTIAQALFNCKT